MKLNCQLVTLSFFYGKIAIWPISYIVKVLVAKMVVAKMLMMKLPDTEISICETKKCVDIFFQVDMFFHVFTSE